jgi:cation diffusion facilitator family transporter
MSDFHHAPAAGAAHDHVFLGAGHERNERKTWAVIALCTAMMLAEIVGGKLFGSLALVADGLHMSTHAGAMLIAALAYRYARKHAHDRRFVFGTGKLSDLAAYTSAIILAMIALLIAYEAVARIVAPVAIDFGEAIPIAVVGLCVNIASAFLLSGADHGHNHDHHDHHHGHHAHAHHEHGHGVDARDHNMRAAYVHVIADAAVSVLAIVGLLLANAFGWLWMDPLAGIAGALVIANWSYGLLWQTGAILVDASLDRKMEADIRKTVGALGDTVADLHVWRLGPGHLGAVLSVVTGEPAHASAFYHRQLARFEGLSHVTVEVLMTATA